MKKILLLGLLFAGAVLAEPELKEYQVGLDNQYAMFSIYNEVVESPDGKRICYIVFDRAPESHLDAVEASLWVCGRDLKNHRMVKKLEEPNMNHNGCSQRWVDNDSIAYSGTVTQKVGDEYQKRSIWVVNVDTGELEHGPFTGGWLGETHGSKILFTIQDNKNNLPSGGEVRVSLETRGLYEVDTATKQMRHLFSPRNFKEYAGKWKGSTNPDGWYFSHLQYSTDGSHIAFTVRTRGKDGLQHLITAKADGSDVRVWGADKPLHFHYYDADTIFGCDYNGLFGSKRMTQRWTRDQELIETVCGPVDHSCGSPDRMWFAGETWRKTVPLELYLYKKGDLQPRATIFSSTYMDIVWKNSAHISPSFSHDGTRLYYHRPVSATQMQIFYTDLTPLVK